MCYILDLQLSIEALYIENISFKSVEWIQKEVEMHPPINSQVNFNEFIKIHGHLQKHNT